jgi:Sigma-70 region 2
MGSERSASRVAASVSARAARSASLKYGASRQAPTMKIRSSSSPAAFSSRECMSRHTLHPLIWLARTSTKYKVLAGTPALRAAASRFCRASIAPGTVIAGLFIRACMLVLQSWGGQPRSHRVDPAGLSHRHATMEERDMTDQQWLAERFEEHRSHLRAVAYRMLGSLSEADDAVQDTWVCVVSVRRDAPALPGRARRVPARLVRARRR